MATSTLPEDPKPPRNSVGASEALKDEPNGESHFSECLNEAPINHHCYARSRLLRTKTSTTYSRVACLGSVLADGPIIRTNQLRVSSQRSSIACNLSVSYPLSQSPSSLPLMLNPDWNPRHPFASFAVILQSRALRIIRRSIH